MGMDTDRLRREDDRRMERLATTIEHMAADVSKMSATLTAIAEGTKMLPQCREHKRDIDDIRDQLREKKGFKSGLTLSGIGAAVALAVKHVWDRVF